MDDVSKLAWRYFAAYRRDEGQGEFHDGVRSIVLDVAHRAAAEFVLALRFHRVPIMVSIEPGKGTWGFTRWHYGRPMTRAVLRKILFSDRSEWLRLRRDAAHDVMIDLAATVMDALRDANEIPVDDMLFVNEDNAEVEHGRRVLALFEEDEEKADSWLYLLAYRTERILRAPGVADKVERVAETLLVTPTMNLCDLLKLLGLRSRRKTLTRWLVADEPTSHTVG